jgi:hypothetical protein
MLMFFYLSARNSTKINFDEMCEVGGPAAWRREVGGQRPSGRRREVDGRAAERPAAKHFNYFSKNCKNKTNVQSDFSLLIYPLNKEIS